MTPCFVTPDYGPLHKFGHARRAVERCLRRRDACASQGEELEPVRGKAEQFGVTEIYIDDLREEFVRDYVFPMFRRASL